MKIHKKKKETKTGKFCVYLTRFNRSAWPDEYCSMTSLTSYGLSASRNFFRAEKYLSFLCMYFIVSITNNVNSEFVKLEKSDRVENKISEMLFELFLSLMNNANEREWDEF